MYIYCTGYMCCCCWHHWWTAGVWAELVGYDMMWCVFESVFFAFLLPFGWIEEDEENIGRERKKERELMGQLIVCTHGVISMGILLIFDCGGILNHSLRSLFQHLNHHIPAPYFPTYPITLLIKTLTIFTKILI